MEDYPGQKRQQDMLQFSLASSFAAAIVVGCAFHSLKAGWYTYLIGLFWTWLINIVDWDYFLCEPTSWSEGKYLDITGFFDLEMRDRSHRITRQRSQITVSGGPPRMTISARELPELAFKRPW